MKNLIIVAFAIFCLNIQAQEAKTYAIKSGYIKYQLGGNTEGTRELWWDDYGQKTCETEKSTTTTKIFGIKNTDEKHSTTVIVKDKFWVADYVDNRGSNGTVPMYQEGQEYVGNMTETEQQEFADEVLAGMGGEKLGTESLNGYKCDIIKLMGFKSWVYKGLVMKTEGKLLGIVTNEMFVDFKPNSTISSSKFNPPSGVNFENLAEQAGAQGFQGALGALGGMDAFEDEDDDEEWETVPVEYSFEKFKRVVNDFSYGGYKCMRTNSLDGIHAATLMKGVNMVMVIAQSEENGDPRESSDFETFKHNGHNCFYGKMDEEDGAALLVEYPKYDMHIVIAGPNRTKEELLAIEDKLQF